MSRFSDNTIVNLIRASGFISSKLSMKGRYNFGKMAGTLLMRLSKKRYEITVNNLREAFPDKNGEWYNDIATKAYYNLGIVLVEVSALKYFSDDYVKKLIKYDNPELINDLHSKGNGLLLLSGHFGNWELLAYSAGLYSGLNISVIAKPQKNVAADTLLNSYRTQRGNKIINMYKAARTIISEMRNAGVIAMLADQSATSDKDIFVDYFGRPASTYEAPAALALKFKSPVIMGFAVRQEDGTYRVKLEEIKHDDLDNTPEGVKELTRRHVKMLEDAVRQNPHLWAWQHRRWKHKPGQQ